MQRFASSPGQQSRRPIRHARTGARGAVAAALAGLALGACDFPTAPPRVETTFVFPAEQTTLTVAELLPASVTLTPGGGGFVLDVAGTAFSRSLRELCEECAAADGLVVPKPAFSSSINDELTLPDEVVSATLTGGSVDVRLFHDFGFDPIRPSSTARGEITATLTSGGTVLGSVTISGEQTSFASGTNLIRTIPLQGAPVSGPIQVEIALTSPAGDPVRVDADAVFSTTVEPGPLTVSQATVRVQDQPVEVEAVTLDTEDVDQSLVDRVRGGAILVDLDNPWAVGGTLTLRLDGIVKTLQVAPGVTTQRVELSREEMQQILGRSVTLSVDGTLSATGGTVTVTPDQELTLDTTLSLIIELGGSES